MFKGVAALKGRNKRQPALVPNDFRVFSDETYVAPSGPGASAYLIQGRRSFVACRWLLHFAPLALSCALRFEIPTPLNGRAGK